MDNSISLVLISKNAEEIIGPALESARLLADEIIFIDTGITDGTLEIARFYNSKIFSYKWQNNFALARNFGIEKARGKWVLILDADEYISVPEAALIRQAVKDEQAGAYIFQQRSHREAAGPVLVSSIRLFRNMETIRYKYAVHEMLTTEKLAQSGLEIKKLDLTIEHSGYETKEQVKQKEKRNLNILKSQLLKEELTDEDFFHYAVYFLRSNLQIAKASSLEKTTGEKLAAIKKRLLEKKIRLNQDFFLFYAVMPAFYAKYNNEIAVNELFQEASEIYPDSPYIFFKFAEFFYKSGNYRKSIELLEKCLAFNNQQYNPEQLIDPGILHSLSYSALAQCYEKLGESGKERKYRGMAEEIV